MYTDAQPGIPLQRANGRSFGFAWWRGVVPDPRGTAARAADRPARYGPPVAGNVQLLQAMPQHLHPGMTVGLAALEAPLDRDPPGRLLQGRWLIRQDDCLRL